MAYFVTEKKNGMLERQLPSHTAEKKGHGEVQVKNFNEMLKHKDEG